MCYISRGSSGTRAIEMGCPHQKLPSNNKSSSLGSPRSTDVVSHKTQARGSTYDCGQHRQGALPSCDVEPARNDES